MFRPLLGSPVIALAAILLSPQAALGNPPDSLGRCVDALRRELPEHAAVRAESFAAYTRDITDLRPAIEAAARSQPEFELPIWDYIAALVDDQRVVDGRQTLERHAQALEAIRKRHVVDPETLVAIFGIETDFGNVRGRYPVVSATLSRACLDLGSRERKSNFFAALWILQEQLVRAQDFNGSWAGAFGLTRFMPDTFVRYMADGDGSGTVDIVGSVPDALATTARYLVSLGWTQELPWGVEVAIPADLAPGAGALGREHRCLSAPRPTGKCRNLGQWVATGVTRVDGRALSTAAHHNQAWSDATVAALFMPAGASGPAWLVTRNFHALWQYNRADAYALAIGLLSDALRGSPKVQKAWPTDDPGLSRMEMKELQSLLVALGHDTILVDGLDGPNTRAAIEVEEQRLGLTVTGRPATKILRLLKTTPAARSEAPHASDPPSNDGAAH